MPQTTGSRGGAGNSGSSKSRNSNAGNDQSRTKKGPAKQQGRQNPKNTSDR